MSLADLAHLIDEPAWMLRAACRGMDSALFFTQKGGNRLAERAKQVCAVCPVSAECLDWALSFPQTYDAGIYGGTSPKERRTLRERAA